MQMQKKLELDENGGPEEKTCVVIGHVVKTVSD